MAPDERVEFLESALDRFLIRARHDDWIQFEATGSADDYVRITKSHGALCAEIGSREPTATATSLGPFAAGFLEMNEFTRETENSNFQRDHLPHESWTLAQMIDRLFGIYELPADFDVLVRGKQPLSARTEARGNESRYTQPRYDSAPVDGEEWNRPRRGRRERRRRGNQQR